jgi:extracellular factor (EF) 3-hydroxypalmitic acid methyl ester biosynthesis protein
MTTNFDREKRSQTRTGMKEGQGPSPSTQNRERCSNRSREDLSKAYVVIPLPFPKGIKIIKKLIDVSENGLSFEMSQEEGFLLPGTIIKNPVVYLNGVRKEAPFAEIVHVTPLKGENSFKMGLQLMADSRARSLFRRKIFAHAIRPIRYHFPTHTPEQKTVHFVDRSGSNHICFLKNISMYGLSFEMQRETNDPILHLGEALYSCEIRIGDTIVYHGKVTVVWLRPEPGKLIVGGFLEKKCDKFKEIILQEEASIYALKPSLSFNVDGVNTSFKALVADLRYVLETVQEILEREEKRVSRNETLFRDRVEDVVLKQYESDVFEYLDSALLKLNVMVSPFDKETDAVHRSYFHKQLWHLIKQSPFAHRCYTKPLGYVGDYEIMDALYRDPYKGDTLFGKLLNKYLCSYNRAARAYRNRISFLIEQIGSAARKGEQEKKNSRILSMTCGPANELTAFIDRSEISNYADLTIVDREPEALYFAHEMLLEAKVLKERRTKINAYYLPLTQLFSPSASQFYPINRQDLIYCSGLFDYLGDVGCRRALKRFFEMLCEGGKLIIGNFDPCNEFKAGMEYCLEWHLRHRTQADLILLAEKSVGTASRIYCEAEETGINNFLIVER